MKIHFNVKYISFISLVKVKGKTICVPGLLQALRLSRSIRLPDFKLIGT